MSADENWNREMELAAIHARCESAEKEVKALRAHLELSAYIGSWTGEQLSAWEAERDRLLADAECNGHTECALCGQSWEDHRCRDNACPIPEGGFDERSVFGV